MLCCVGNVNKEEEADSEGLEGKQSICMRFLGEGD